MYCICQSILRDDLQYHQALLYQISGYSHATKLSSHEPDLMNVIARVPPKLFGYQDHMPESPVGPRKARNYIIVSNLCAMATDREDTYSWSQ